MAPRACGAAPLGIGRLWQGIFRGVSRLSPRLVSTAVSAADFGLFALAAVSFLRFWLCLWRLVLSFVVVVSRCPFFSFAFGVGSSFVRRFRVCD